MMKYHLIVAVAAVVGVVSCLVGIGNLQAASFVNTADNYPQRIVSLGPINTENIFLLGAGDRLVGDTVYCVRPEAAKKKIKVGSMMEISVEKIVSLHPDLILATGLTSSGLIQKLMSLDMKVVRFDQPSSLAGSCDQFLELGRLLGLEDQARDIIRNVKLEIEKIHQKTTTLPSRKVFLQIGSQPLYGSVNDSFTHDFIELANGINIIGDQANGRTDYEKVIVENPDVIIIAIMGSESGIAGREKRKWQQFPIINAVRQDRIHIVDPAVACSPSPATFVEALKLIAGFIHPEAHLEDLP